MFSLAAQERDMIVYAQKQGFTIAGVTAEHGSGLNFSRKGIKAISNAIESHKANVLLVKDLSRLGRDLEEVDVYLHWLKKHNAEVVCADGTAPRLYTDILDSLINEYEHLEDATV